MPFCAPTSMGFIVTSNPGNTDRLRFRLLLLGDGLLYSSSDESGRLSSPPLFLLPFPPSPGGFGGGLPLPPGGSLGESGGIFLLPPPGGPGGGFPLPESDGGFGGKGLSSRALSLVGIWLGSRRNLSLFA